MCLCSHPGCDSRDKRARRQPNSKTHTEAETAKTGDLVLDNNLILLDSEIPKPHKNPNFDRLAKSIEISLGTASFPMRSGSDSRGSADPRPGAPRLGSKPRGIVRQTGLSRG